MAQTNGVKDEAGADVDEEDEEDEGTESPVVSILVAWTLC